MTLNEILIILQNRVIALNESKKMAVSSGDLQKTVEIDNDLITTLTSIELISQSLTSVTSTDINQ